MIPQQAVMKDALNEARCSNELLEHLEHLHETNDLFGNVAKSQGQCPGILNGPQCRDTETRRHAGYECRVPRHPSTGTMPAFRPRRLIANEPATSAITSLRDDEVTERCHGYQNYFFSLSLFQLKDEPEGEGNRAVEEGSFWFEIG